jgi:STE24 endopeptidase
MNESKATRYQRLRRRARAASAGSAALMLAVIALTPLSRWLREFALTFASGLSGVAAVTVALVLFVVLVVVLWELASLPAAIYLARRVESAYGQSALSPTSPPSIEELLAEQAQATVVALPAALAASGAVVVAVQLAGAWWWVVAGPMLALLLALALRLAPFLFARLGRVRPLDRPSLTVRLSTLAARARVPVVGVDEWVVDESSPATALVTGVGPTRRILLSSEVARRWTDDEVVVVVAHELAHHVYRDLWRTFAVHVAVLWASLFAAQLVVTRLTVGGAGDLAALPLVALVTCGVWILATPLRNAQSRRHERRADTFALTMTGGVEAFGSAVTRLGARHLAEERPSALTRWLYHSHPSVAERLALAEAFQKVQRPVEIPEGIKNRFQGRSPPGSISDPR